MSKPIDFMFEGRTFSALDGDTIASALIKNNQLAFRVTEQNKFRGIFCGMGVCNECAVSVDGKEGILACVTPLKSGMNIELQNQYRESPEINSEISQLPESEINCDVLIIGAGPAGLAAAKKLGEFDLNITLIDERKSLGGQYYKQPAEAFDVPLDQLDEQFLEGRTLIDAVKGKKIKVITNTKIWGAFDANHLVGYNENSRYVFRPKYLVIATGAYERGIPIPNWTLPGVFTTGAAQTLLRSYQTSIPGRIIICGNGPLNLQIAAELIKAKANVLAYVDSAKLFSIKNLLLSPILGLISPKLGFKGLGYIMLLAKNKVKIFSQSVPINFYGTESLSVVEISKLKGEIPNRDNVIKMDVESITLGFGFAPSNEIAKLLGCQLELDKNTLSNRVKTNFAGQTSVNKVLVIGDSASINGAQIAKYRGKLLALNLLKELDKSTKFWNLSYLITSFSLLRNLAFQKVLWNIFKSPKLLTQLAEDETVVCRCLNVTKGDLQTEVTKDVRSAGSVKRITRAGMGKCQGRYCAPIIQELLSLHFDQSIDEFSSFAPQVPIKPTPIGVMAYPLESKDS